MNCPLCHSKSIESYLELPLQYWLCTICDLVWLDSSRHLSSENEKERYFLHENSLEDPIYLEFLSRLAKPMSKYISDGMTGIDFGAGSAQGMAKLFPHCAVDSYDPYFSPNLNKDSIYDFVLCSEVVEHFNYPKRDFDLIHGLLKTKGFLGISSQLRPEKKDFVNWYYRRDPTHISFFAEKTVRWLAHYYKLKILEIVSPIWILQKE